MTLPAAARLKIICPVCCICGECATVEVDAAAWMVYQEGALIQDALPDMPREERETLITGIHDACWRMLMGVGEDD